MSKRKLTAEDIFHIDLVGDVAVHPDKPTAVAVVAQLQPEDNAVRSHLWMISTNSSDSVQFTHSSKSEKSPGWSPDGRWLAFLSDRNTDHMQLFLMRDSGGEAVQVTDIAQGVNAFCWRPDGRAIAFLSTVPEWARDDTDNSPAKDDTRPPRARFTKDVRTLRRSYYRLDGVGFFDGKRTHLFLVDVQEVIGASRQANHDPATPQVRLTEGLFDIDRFDWGADGRSLVVSTNVDADNYERTLSQHLYQLDVPEHPLTCAQEPQGAADLRCLTASLHSAASPKVSPDGRFVAFRGHNNVPLGAAQTRLYLYEFQTAKIVCLTETVDEWFENRALSDTRTDTSDALTWSMQSDIVYSLVSRHGTTQLVGVHVKTRQVMQLTRGEHTVLAYSINRVCDAAVLNIGTRLDPANVYTLELYGDFNQPAPRRLTDRNSRFAAEVELIDAQRFSFESDGVTLDGWVMLPDGPPPKSGWPTVVQVHGGPAMMYSDAFMFEFQLLAASGMAVISTNPRGSVGYGQDFCACIVANWGHLDFRDVEALADAALSNYPLDPQNVAIAGGSYGGFMSAWAIGHTKRYRAAVVMRAVINWMSMVGSGDVGFATPFDEFAGAVPWEDTETYLQQSPITYVGNVDASTLIIHSEEDYRCPIEQGEQFYAALRYRGVPVEFVRFPNESHGLSRNGKPWHRVVRLEKIQSFLEQELVSHQEER